MAEGPGNYRTTGKAQLPRHKASPTRVQEKALARSYMGEEGLEIRIPRNRITEYRILEHEILENRILAYRILG